MASLAVVLDAPQEIRIAGRREGGRNVEHVFTAELERALFSEGALAAPGAAEDQGVERYDAPSRSTDRNVPTSRSFSFAPRTATRKNSGPSP
jgi:hypothetical protein